MNYYYYYFRYSYCCYALLLLAIIKTGYASTGSSESKPLCIGYSSKSEFVFCGPNLCLSAPKTAFESSVRSFNIQHYALVLKYCSAVSVSLEEMVPQTLRVSDWLIPEIGAANFSRFDDYVSETVGPFSGDDFSDPKILSSSPGVSVWVPSFNELLERFSQAYFDAAGRIVSSLYYDTVGTQVELFDPSPSVDKLNVLERLKQLFSLEKTAEPDTPQCQLSGWLTGSGSMSWTIGLTQWFSRYGYELSLSSEWHQIPAFTLSHEFLSHWCRCLVNVKLHHPGPGGVAQSVSIDSCYRSELPANIGLPRHAKLQQITPRIVRNSGDQFTEFPIITFNIHLE